MSGSDVRSGVASGGAAPGLEGEALRAVVSDLVQAQPVTDMHTHVFAPSFGVSPEPNGLMLWGIDELLTYHYLIAEVFRVATPDQMPFDTFWAMSQKEQADHIWKTLFVERSPVSEACRGVITTLSKLGLDPNEKDLRGYRAWFAAQDPSDHVDNVMRLANVDQITMTNEVFDAHEHNLWMDRPDIADDPRFTAVLRIDKLLLDYPGAAAFLRERGYDFHDTLDDHSVEQGRQFLFDWLDRMNAAYIAVSLPPDWAYPSKSDTDKVLEEIVLPVCQERNIPFAMMIGVTRGVNPMLRLAGDMVAKADVASAMRLFAAFPDNRFMVTMLARENQHELTVAGRKFPNLMVFGCWWFLNNPSLIEEMTRMRMELLGTSFVPQHSDCRILEQLVYKWDHSRRIIAKVLTDKYEDLTATGYRVTQEKIARDVALLLRENYLTFQGG